MEDWQSKILWAEKIVKRIKKMKKNIEENYELYKGRARDPYYILEFALTGEGKIKKGFSPSKDKDVDDSGLENSEDDSTITKAKCFVDDLFSDIQKMKEWIKEEIEYMLKLKMPVLPEFNFTRDTDDGFEEDDNESVKYTQDKVVVKNLENQVTFQKGLIEYLEKEMEKLWNDVKSKNEMIEMLIYDTPMDCCKFDKQNESLLKEVIKHQTLGDSLSDESFLDPEDQEEKDDLILTKKYGITDEEKHANEEEFCEILQDAFSKKRNGNINNTLGYRKKVKTFPATSKTNLKRYFVVPLSNNRDLVVLNCSTNATPSEEASVQVKKAMSDLATLMGNAHNEVFVLGILPSEEDLQCKRDNFSDEGVEVMKCWNYSYLK